MPLDFGSTSITPKKLIRSSTCPFQIRRMHYSLVREIIMRLYSDLRSEYFSLNLIWWLVKGSNLFLLSFNQAHRPTLLTNLLILVQGERFALPRLLRAGGLQPPVVTNPSLHFDFGGNYRNRTDLSRLAKATRLPLVHEFPKTTRCRGTFSSDQNYFTQHLWF